MPCYPRSTPVFCHVEMASRDVFEIESVNDSNLTLLDYVACMVEPFHDVQQLKEGETMLLQKRKKDGI